MRTLIFDNVLSGHHLEYIHHLYVGAMQKKSEEFIFAVPRDAWNMNRDKCVWHKADNIHWLMLDDQECEKVSQGSMIARCFKLSKFIKHIAIQEGADRIKLISLAGVIPILPLILPSRIKLSGIIYKIYLRAPKTGIRKIMDYFRYTVMSKSQSVDKVYILNDPRSTERLNNTYHTERFKTLADPVPEPDMSKVVNLRNDLNIPESATVFLHFGAMDSRKGTLEIVQAINLLSVEDLNNKYFIFAGKINNSVKEQFYKLAGNAKQKGANIIIRDEFCSYEYLYSLCYSSDCILIPYKLTDLSSGALGYAALFGKPVIGPSSGLIGELIIDNKLGISLDEIKAESIAKTINDFRNISIHTSYVENNSINAFCKTILDN